jgi:hypothetical protein
MFSIYVREAIPCSSTLDADPVSPLAEAATDGTAMDDLFDEDVEDPDDEYDDNGSFIDNSFTYPEDSVDYVPDENEDPEYDLGYFYSHICFCAHPSHGQQITQARLDGLLGHDLFEDNDEEGDELSEDYDADISTNNGDGTRQ